MHMNEGPRATLLIQNQTAQRRREQTKRTSSPRAMPAALDQDQLPSHSKHRAARILADLESCHLHRYCYCHPLGVSARRLHQAAAVNWQSWCCAADLRAPQKRRTSRSKTDSVDVVGRADRAAVLLAPRQPTAQTQTCQNPRTALTHSVPLDQAHQRRQTGRKRQTADRYGRQHPPLPTPVHRFAVPGRCACASTAAVGPPAWCDCGSGGASRRSAGTTRPGGTESCSALGRAARASSSACARACASLCVVVAQC